MTNTLHTAIIYGEPSKEIMDTEICVSHGSGRKDMNWVGETVSVSSLCVGLSKHRIGHKDGPAITQGSLVGPQRVAKNVSTNYLLMVDIDTGVPLDQIADKMEDKGLFCIIWATHSHLNTTTDIPEETLIRYVRAQGGTAESIDEVSARDFLLKEKHYVPELFSTLSMEKEHRNGGMKYVVHHEPMERGRVLCVLEKPFEIAKEAASQKQAIDKWKEMYSDFCDGLDLHWDKSCVDPSRLMYLPSIKEGADPKDYPIWILEGDLLKRSHIESSKIVGDPFLDRKSSSDDKGFVTQNLLKFVSKHGDDFMAADCMRDYNSDSVINDKGEELDCACPNADYHSDQKADDSAFHVVNPGVGGFAMWCLHAGCIESSNKDRAWYLDKFCQNEGILDAMDLLEYCPEYSEEKDKQVQAKTELEERVEKQDGPMVEESVLNIIGSISLERTAFKRMVRCKELAKQQKFLTLAEIKIEVKHLSLKAQLKKLKEEGAALDVTTFTGVISSDWDEMVQCASAKSQLEIISATPTKDTLYRDQSGAPVSLTQALTGNQRIAIKKVPTGSWVTILGNKLKFSRYDQTKDVVKENCFPPDDIVKYIKGIESGWNFPVIKAVTTVPRLCPDMTLHASSGYNPDTQMYLNAAFDIVLPDVISEDQVEWALDLIFNNAVRDFPFADFTDSMLPIQLKEKDEDGFYLPNLDRGSSSRANFLAMLLQAFVRPVIQGPCPSYHIHKAAAGTGGTLLMKVVSWIVDGRDPPTTQWKTNEQECLKTITASLMSAPSAVFFDNINNHVDSGVLASALTAGVWTDRILGRSEITDLPIECLWVMTGNNLTMSQELMRRSVPIHIDASTADPGRDRSAEALSWKHDDLQEWCKENREDLITACLTLVMYWAQHGAQHGSAKLNSFNQWAGVMSGIIETCGVSMKLLENRDTYLSHRDNDTEEDNDLVKLLFSVFGVESKFSAQEALDAITDRMTGQLKVEVPIPGSSYGNKELTPKAVGEHLTRKVADRTFNVLDNKKGKEADADAVVAVKFTKTRTAKGNRYSFALVPNKTTDKA